MKLARPILAILIVLACSAPAAADVKYTRKMEGRVMAGSMSGTSVQYIKGSRMRDDQTMAGAEMSSIIDVESQQLILLNHKQRQAEIMDMSRIAAEFAKIPASDIQAKVTPSGETRDIAGVSCAVHAMDVTVPMNMGGQEITMRMTGPVCIANNGPGQADVAAFYTAVADKGLFFGDVRAAKAQGGQARAMTALYEKIASLGVPMAQDMTIKMEGEGPMAAMMAKMGGTTMSTEVVSFSTDPIPDSMFEVPEGYKVVKR